MTKWISYKVHTDIHTFNACLKSFATMVFKKQTDFYSLHRIAIFLCLMGVSIAIDVEVYQCFPHVDRFYDIIYKRHLLVAYK